MSKQHIVYFEYLTAGEHGSDKFRYSSPAEAQAKFQEFRHAIEQNFAGCPAAEVVDEPGFFGIIDNQGGDWAKVICQQGM